MKSNQINKLTKICIDVLYVVNIVCVIAIFISGIGISFMLWQSGEIPLYLSLLIAIIGVPLVCLLINVSSMYFVCLLAQLYKLNENN